MSDRSNTANVAQAGVHGHRSGSCAWALVILVMTWTGMPGTARADAIILQNGESIDGSIVDATRNTVIVRRAIGGMRQMSIQDIAEVRVDLAQGEQIAGQLLGWVDGVHEVRSGGEIVRIGAGRILTRERHDQATTPRPPSLPQRPLVPRPGEGPTVKAAGPAATAPEVERAEDERAQAAAAKVAPARGSAAVVTATGIPRTKDTPAAAAPAPVGPARVAAAPRAVAPVVEPVAEVGIADIAAAEASAAAIASPAVAVPETTAAVGVLSKAATAQADTAKITAAEIGPAGGDAAKAAVAALPPAEVSATEGATRPEGEKDDQLLAVRGTVDPAEAGADGMVFRIELSRPAEQPVVLIYGTVDGTAIAGKDYEPQQGVVTLTPGSRSADVRVPLIEHRRSRVAAFELFLAADPKVATVVDRRITATIPAD